MLFRSLLCCLSIPGPALAGAPPCSAPGPGWCVAHRFPGSVEKGELGFRFGEPLDADGDGHADVAAGTRFERQKKRLQGGSATVWSGATGAVIRKWDGKWPDGLFGHSVIPVPDLSGDGLADVVVSAPHATRKGHLQGVVMARSPLTGEELWKRTDAASDNLGWDVALAGDQDGDGRTDLFVGAPGYETGHVHLLSGKDGKVLRTFAPRDEGASFGWYVARLDDLDGDGHADLAVGAPYAKAADAAVIGGAWVFSSASGKELQHWRGTDRRSAFGTIVAAVADVDGDGKGDVAVTAPATEDQQRTLPGELYIYSSATGAELRHWSGSQPGEIFARMVVGAGDLDGDGIEDVAIGAPWHRRGADDRVGRVELRAGRSGALLAEFFGEHADCWFGWHIRRAPDPEGHGRPALLISSLRQRVDGKLNAGALDLYVLRRADGAGDQGTISRDVRRSDIR